MRQLMGILLPVLTIKWLHLDLRRRLVQAAQIDGHAIRVRTRHVEGLDTAGFAEKMFGHSSAKVVNG